MRPLKQLLLDEVKDNIDRTDAFIIARYSSMTVAQSSDLRARLIKVGGDLQVVKKRVFVKAAEAAGITIDVDKLEGHIAIVYTGDDSVETAKTVYGFCKDTQDTVQVVAGHFDNRFLAASEVETLSKLPGKDAMRAQLLGLFEAPMSQTLATMEALLTSVIHCMDNKCKQDEGINA